MIAVPWNWKTDKKEEQNHLVLMQDHYIVAHHYYQQHESEQTQISFKQAEQHLEWLLIHNPAFNPLIYRIGKEIYQRMIILIKDPGQQVYYMVKSTSLAGMSSLSRIYACLRVDSGNLPDLMSVS